MMSLRSQAKGACIEATHVQTLFPERMAAFRASWLDVEIQRPGNVSVQFDGD
jgi:hypothetical protein